MKIARKIHVLGKVQNVGFRYYTHKKAHELNLAGFVKNQQDGSVYIEVMGVDSKIKEFVIWCHSGPKWARVEDVQVQQLPLFEYSGFNIK